MITTHEIKVGQYVSSKAGRDQGQVFIIIKIVDEKFVEITDGDLRRIEKPKLKKIKHLSKINKISEVIAEKVADGKKVSNLMVRREIEKLELK
jgi:ribosomal protein L14E/L6E/L27E